MCSHRLAIKNKLPLIALYHRYVILLSSSMENNSSSMLIAAFTVQQNAGIRILPETHLSVENEDLKERVQ